MEWAEFEPAKLNVVKKMVPRIGEVRAVVKDADTAQGFIIHLLPGSRVI
jgi:hypothetical protein